MLVRRALAGAGRVLAPEVLGGSMPFPAARQRSVTAGVSMAVGPSFRQRYPFALLLVVPTLTELIETGRLPSEPRELVTDTVVTALVAFLIWRLSCAHQEVLALSHTDPLTGLMNRRAFDRDLPKEVARAHRQDTQLVLAYIDVDGFKSVNDRHGHDVGDHVLVELARLLKKHFRDSVDTAYRIGGDEFAVLAPVKDRDGVRELRARLDTLSAVVGRNLERYGADLSVGAADLRPGETARSLTARADQLMYVEKGRSGRPSARP